MAAAGAADGAIVAEFLRHPWFDRPPLKSLDRDQFISLSQAVERLTDADAAATLVGALAGSVAAGFRWLPHVPSVLLVCGGGRRNPVIMARLAEALPCEVRPVETAGLDGDMLEAQAFGWLAARVMRGLPTSGPTTTGVPASCCGGRISHPRR